LLNPLKAFPSIKPSLKPSLKLSSKPKEIIDLGVISLRSYQLSPPSYSMSPFKPLSPLSPPPVIQYITPAQLLDELRQKDIATRKYMPPQQQVPSSTPITTQVLII
jgi:hypothetical protein